MRLHVHTGHDAEVRTIPDAAEGSSLADHVQVTVDLLVFKVDDEGPELDPSARLSDLFDGPSGRVVTHPGRQITVVVDYAGASATLTVSPGTRLSAVRDQAISQLGIDSASAADLGLRAAGGAEDLPLDKPIASIAKGADHVDLELIALVRPQG
ncbi:hypothetical protein OSC27_14195 [Microbacterium sp. STN6]|uniref:hypothetical protein n=1 Tax=Microbacterium sp. STN6 TaxID=2995588 RepID=UPI0022608546|nr:hypothetical protein [Microbacterium sp. STN6]MCX7523422.1 hypothetical protein [Microbacterium sp. STN6]